MNHDDHLDDSDYSGVEYPDGDEVTMAASDQVAQQIQAEANRDSRELSVWTTNDEITTPGLPQAPTSPPEPHSFGGNDGLARGDRFDLGDDFGIGEEPTVIRGFGAHVGEDLTAPLADSVASQIADQQQEVAEPVEPVERVARSPRVKRPQAAAPPASISGPSLIDGVAPPQSATSFFELHEMAPDAAPAERLPSGRKRLPVGVLFLALAVVAVTVTVVLAALLGSSAL